MSLSNDTVIQRYKAGKNAKSGSGFLFSNGDVLYSFGAHFPLAVRRLNAEGKEWYLLNGDRSTHTTNHHVSLTWRHFEGQPRVSFSALRAAGLSYNQCELVDYWKDEAAYKYPSDGEEFTTFNPPIGSTFGEEKDPHTGEVSYKWWHRIGSVVLRQNGYDYLCSMDEGSYFISKLPQKVESVEEAFRVLKPLVVVDAEEGGLEIKRQGEWFFIPTPFKRAEFKVVTKSLPLPVTRVGSNSHLVTHIYADPWEMYGYLVGGVFVSGLVRHREHKKLRLDDGVIYRARRNTELDSWSAAGKVD
jgi:hypothetical protein